MSKKQPYPDIASIKILIIFLCIEVISCKEQEKREVITLSGQWSFIADSTAAGDSANWPAAGLPAGLIRKVSVPHTWNAEKKLARYTGKAWYERTFEVTQQQLSKTIRLQFDAVYHDAIIYINGKKAGEHIGSGYNRFFIDVTPFVKAGENRLTVCADNSFSRSNIPFMRSYDWACDGGIYRNVYEIITSKYAIRNIHVAATPADGKGKTKITISFVDPEMIDPSKLVLKATISEENQPTGNIILDGPLNGRLRKVPSYLISPSTI